MTYPRSSNPFGSPGALVDRRVGNAYPLIKEVHDSLTEILYVAANLQNLIPKDIELQESADKMFVQWRYVGDANWKNLLPLVDLPQAEFQVSGDWLQWRYRGEVTWINLWNVQDFFDQVAVVPTASKIPRAGAAGKLDTGWLDLAEVNAAPLTATEQVITDLAEAGGASLVGFTQPEDGATLQTTQTKLRNSTPVDPSDFGADPTGTTDSSTGIFKALKTGRPVIGLGKYRISAPVIWDAGENINLNADSATRNQLNLRTVFKDPGNFTAISVRNARRPDVRIAFSGGGNGLFTDIGIDWQNVEGMYLWLTGFAFNGLLANYDGTQGQWVENVGGIIHARKCLKAFQFQGPAGNNAGTGKLDTIWDVLPAYGSNFANLSDLTVGHIENTIIQSVFQATTSLGMVNLASAHFGKINLGNGAPTLLNINGCTNVDIDSLYLVGGGDNTGNTSTVTGLDTHNNGLVKIGKLTMASCLVGGTIGNGSNMEVGTFNGLQNGRDFVLKGATSVLGFDLAFDEYFSQQSYGESILTDASVTNLTGRVTIKGGRIRTGNIGGASTGAINLSPAALTSGTLFTRADNLDIDVEPGVTKHPASLKCYFRGYFSGRGNRFLSTAAIQDSFGSVSGPDGRGFLLDNPPQSFATWTANPYYVSMQIWVPFRFETTSVAGEFCTLQLKSPSGTVYDLVDTRYLPATITIAQYFTLKAIVPPGWSYQFVTSNSAHATFQGSPRSVSV